MKEQVNATRDQIENFKSSVLWHDIVEELEAWKEGFSMELDSVVDDATDNNPSTASVLMHIGDLNGRKKAVNYMLGIPDLFLSILEDKKDDTRRKRTD